MGLSKPYLVSDGATTHSHIPCVRGKKLAGTARYASISTHLGFEQGRRDDLESIAYVLQYLLNGSLPWKGIHASSKLQKYKLIGDKKQACKLSDLCEGFPELETYIQYCRTLGFTEMPDYEYIKGLFNSALSRNGWHLDYAYDWKRMADTPSHVSVPPTRSRMRKPAKCHFEHIADDRKPRCAAPNAS